MSIDTSICQWRGDDLICLGATLATLRVAVFEGRHLVRRDVYGCADHVADLQKMWRDLGAAVTVVPGLPKANLELVKQPFKKGGPVHKQMLKEARRPDPLAPRQAHVDLSKEGDRTGMVGFDPATGGFFAAKVVKNRNGREYGKGVLQAAAEAWCATHRMNRTSCGCVRTMNPEEREHHRKLAGYDLTDPCDPDYVPLEKRHPAFAEVCVVTTFDVNAKPPGIPFRDHLQTFRLCTQRTRNTVWEQMQVIPDILAVHPTLMHLVEAQRNYVPERIRPASARLGYPHKVGELRGEMGVWVDVSIPQDTGYVARKADRPFIPMGGIEVRNL